MIDELIRALHRMEEHHQRHCDYQNAQVNLLTKILKEIRHMSTSLPGLDALAAADQKVADAITNLSTVITSAVAALQSTVNNAAEDAKVSDIAADFNTKADALNAVAKQLSDAVTPPAPTA